jgi:hypothetical protein
MKELIWFTIDRNSMQIRNTEIDRSLGGSGALKLQQGFDEAQVIAKLGVRISDQAHSNSHEVYPWVEFQ